MLSKNWFEEEEEKKKAIRGVSDVSAFPQSNVQEQPKTYEDAVLELLKAQSAKSQQKQDLADWARIGGMAGKAFGAGPDNGVYDALDKSAQRDVSRAEAVKDYILKQRGLDSKQQITPYQQQMLALKEKDIQAKQQNAAAARAESQQTKNEIKKERAARQNEQDVQKLADKLGNTQELFGALGNVEKNLGYKLDEYNESKDLPGISVPGIGRVTFFDKNARELESAISKVFNVELKDRSGAAVTTPEMERLKEEFGKGKFNSESEMMKALLAYKQMAEAELRNREAAFTPEARQTYQERGGFTSDKLQQSQTKTKTDPRIQSFMKKNGITDENEAIRILKENGRL